MALDPQAVLNNSITGRALQLSLVYTLCRCIIAAAAAAVQDIKNSYKAAMMRGLPQPIVYTLGFFSADDGGFVWQRAIRSAGHFSYIIFWYVDVVTGVVSLQ